jgi:hypothetical protein
MERRGDGQQHGTAHALCFRDLDRAFDRRLVARHHHLAAAIVVSHLADFTLCRFASNGGGRIQLHADQRGHGADPDRHRLLHRLSADAQQPRGVGDGKSTGGGKRGIFAERVTGDELRLALKIEPRFRLQHADDGERDRHQRRLGILGERQRVRGPVEHDGAQALAERLVHHLEHSPCRREVLRQCLAHTHRLAALARKYESD